jgi:hypothetical protein
MGHGVGLRLRSTNHRCDSGGTGEARIVFIATDACGLSGLAGEGLLTDE